jgi:hypothetical protein
LPIEMWKNLLNSKWKEWMILVSSAWCQKPTKLLWIRCLKCN